MHTESLVSHAAVPGTQKVVVVNGSPEIIELLETVLDAGRYDMVFVEASQHAYSFSVSTWASSMAFICSRCSSWIPRRVTFPS